MNKPKKDSKKKQYEFEVEFQDSQANFSEQELEGNDHDAQNQGGCQAIQLIKIKQNGKIQVNEAALDLISSYNQAIGFVSLVGKMRTGKSCLLNRLLQLKGNGFKVDPSVTSCTQGIWMWTKPQYNINQNNLIFYLDTEGTDSLEKDVQNDTKIFTLSLLISSFFIYNSVGSIDQRSLSELEMITALSKQIKTDQKISDRDNQQNLFRYMPRFLWLLRDFTLKIEDEKGRKISPTQYLQNCLTDQNSNDRINQDSRKIKKSIMNYFKDRQCMTMVRPVGDEGQLQKLNTIPDHALRKQFIEGIKTLREKINNYTGPKIFEGHIITGPAMASMIQSYVDAFNSDRVPNIKSAWQQISQDEGAAAFNRALQKYEQIFKQQFPNDNPKDREIYESLARLKQESIKEFQINCFNQKNQEYLKKLKALLKEKETSILQINDNMNEARNHQILKKCSQKMRTKIESNKYNQNKGQIQGDLNQITANYNKQAKGERKAQILNDFMKNLTPILLSIQTDNSAQIQQEKRLAKIKADQDQKQIRLLKQQIESMKKQKQNQQNASTLKPVAPNAKVGRANPKLQEKERSGCCTGDKCQIM